MGKIEKILKSLAPDCVCVLLNAIYFKGEWASRFELKHTKDQPFHVSATEKTKVPLMFQEGEFRRCSFAGGIADVIELPYKDEQLSMIVLLPKMGGLSALETALTPESLSASLVQLDKSSKRDHKVFLPRFKLETDYTLGTGGVAPTGPLPDLGMVDVFDKNRANLQGITPTPAWVSLVAHKAVCEVNEEGTVAVAATAVGMIYCSKAPDPFRADRPFLYLIRHNSTGSVLFLGRMTDPGRPNSTPVAQEQSATRQRALWR